MEERSLKKNLLDGSSCIELFTWNSLNESPRRRSNKAYDLGSFILEAIIPGGFILGALIVLGIDPRGIYPMKNSFQGNLS